MVSDEEFKGVANCNLAAATTALAGVASLVGELRDIIGPDAAKRVEDAMLARLGQFDTPEAFSSAVSKEIQDRCQGKP